MGKAITKQWLIEQGIEVEDGKIYHTSSWGRMELHPTLNNKKHKYGKDMSYYLVGWHGNDKKQHTIPLHRLLYLWSKGDIPEGYDIDHKNGISTDNRLENLEMVTHKENLRRRKIQGNQYLNENVLKKLLKEKK